MVSSANDISAGHSELGLGEYLDFLRSYLGPHRRRVILLAVLLAASIALQLVNPQIIRGFIDAAQAGAMASELAMAGVAFIAIGLLQRAVALSAVYLAEKLGWAATNALRGDLFRHTLRLDMPYHKQHTPGELIERIDGDTVALSRFFSEFILRVAGNVLLIMGILILLYREDWRLGLGLTAYAAVTLLVLGTLQGVAARRWQGEREATAELFGYVEERYHGVEDLRSAGAEAHAMQGLDQRTTQLTRAGLAAFFVQALITGATNVIFLVGYVAGLALGAYLFTTGRRDYRWRLRSRLLRGHDEQPARSRSPRDAGPGPSARQPGAGCGLAAAAKLAARASTRRAAPPAHLCYR